MIDPLTGSPIEPVGLLVAFGVVVGLWLLGKRYLKTRVPVGSSRQSDPTAAILNDLTPPQKREVFRKSLKGYGWWVAGLALACFVLVAIANSSH